MNDDERRQTEEIVAQGGVYVLHRVYRELPDGGHEIIREWLEYQPWGAQALAEFRQRIAAAEKKDE